MLFNAVSTLGLSRRLQGSLTELQIASAKTGDEIASGRRYDVAGYLGARTGQLVSLRGLYDATEESLLTIDALDARFGLMDSALTSIHTVANDVLAQAATLLGQPSGTAESLAIKARGALNEIIGLLNASGGGSYLFSGTEVDTAPMRQVGGDASGLPAPIDIVKDTVQAAAGGNTAPQDAAQTAAAIAALDDLFGVRNPEDPLPPTITHAYEGAFYRGTSTERPTSAGGGLNARLTARPESDLEVPYGIQANDPEVREILKGLYMLAAVDTTAMPAEAYQPYMQEAVQALSDGLSSLRDTTAQLGIRQASLIEESERLTARQKVMSTQITAMEAVDPAETGVRLTQLEQQMEMTANATARIARMRLTEYL